VSSIKKKKILFILILFILIFIYSKLINQLDLASPPHIMLSKGKGHDKLKEKLSLIALEYTKKYFDFDINLDDYHISLFKGDNNVMTREWTKGTENYLFLVATHNDEAKDVQSFLLIYNFVEDKVTGFSIRPAKNSHELIDADID